MNVEALTARLEAARESLPDPGMEGRPAIREKILERGAILDRYRHGLGRRTIAVEQARSAIRSAEQMVTAWNRIEAALADARQAAHAKLARGPVDRRLVQEEIDALNAALDAVDGGVERPLCEGRGAPLTHALNEEFGGLDAPRPRSYWRSELPALRTDLGEAEKALDRELASLAAFLDEIEADPLAA
jgi:hypothetical protein